MKKFLLILLFVASFATYYGGDLLQYFSVPPRKIQIGQNEKFHISPDNLQIVLHPEAYRSTHFAAEELSQMLGQILGKPIPVVTVPDAEKFSIILGLSPLSQAAGLKPEELCRDGYFIRTVGDKLYIAGLDSEKFDTGDVIRNSGTWAMNHERGTLFGVYDFLERFAGARLYFPGELGTILPKLNALNLPEIDIFDRPDRPASTVQGIWFKDTYFEGPNPEAVRHPMKKLDIIRKRQPTTAIQFHHGLRRLNYQERFGKSHPEYFVLQKIGRRTDKSHFCLSSGLREEIYQDVKALLAQDVSKRPGLEKSVQWIFRKDFFPFIDLMPEDGMIACECDKCQKAYTQNPNYASDLMWNFWFEVSRRLKEEKIEGFIDVPSYFPYHRIPDSKLPDNMLFHISLPTGPWRIADSGQIDQAVATVRQAAENTAIGKISLTSGCNKNEDHSNYPGIPIGAPRAWGEFYEKMFPYLFKANVYTFSDRYLHNYLNYYVFYKLAWDSGFNWRNALDEHYRLMFGVAAPRMQTIMERFENILILKVASNTIESPMGPRMVPPSDHDLFEKIYSPEVLDEFEKEFALAEKDTSGVEKQRVQLFRREFFDPLKQASMNYFKTREIQEAFCFWIGEKPSRFVELVPFKSSGKQTVRTRVWAWMNNRELAFRFECEEPSAEVIAHERKFDDPDVWQDNGVEIFLNPDGNGNQTIQLLLNSAGASGDLKLTRSGRNTIPDWKWSSGATFSSKMEEGRWIAEVSIPRSALPELNPKRFMANFTRRRVLKSGNNEIEMRYTWSPFISGYHDMKKFGIIKTGSNLIANGDFSGPLKESKRVAHPVNAVIDGQVFFSAPSSLRLSSTGDKAFYGDKAKVRFKPSTRYRFSFTVKCKDIVPQKTTGGAFIVISDGERNRFLPAKVLQGSCDWTQFAYEFTTAATLEEPARSPGFSCRLEGASGTVWFDNIAFEELPLDPAQSE